MSIQVANHDVETGLTYKQNRELTRDDVPDEWEYAVFDADDFIIHGPASVEIEDREGQEIRMSALEGALDRFFESEETPGIISLKHDDVVVGRPLREYTLENGDTVRTEIDGDTFYLTAHIGNDTVKGKHVRLQCLSGELDGYSVTIFSREEGRRESDGTRVTTKCDLHAVTLGSGEQIVNQEAGFDVVDYKYGVDLQKKLVSGICQKLVQEPESDADPLQEKLKAHLRQKGDIDDPDRFVTGPRGGMWTREQLATTGVGPTEWTVDTDIDREKDEFKDRLQEFDEDTFEDLVRSAERGVDPNQIINKISYDSGVTEEEARNFVGSIITKAESVDSKFEEWVDHPHKNTQFRDYVDEHPNPPQELLELDTEGRLEVTKAVGETETGPNASPVRTQAEWLKRKLGLSTPVDRLVDFMIDVSSFDRQTYIDRDGPESV